jgi:hypothetical protein
MNIRISVQKQKKINLHKKLVYYTLKNVARKELRIRYSQNALLYMECKIILVGFSYGDSKDVKKWKTDEVDI